MMCGQSVSLERLINMMMMNSGQFERRGKELTGRLDSLNKEKSKLLLEVGKLEQEAEVMIDLQQWNL